jgi:hypothetical protein
VALVVERAGLARRVARLAPLGVVKGGQARRPGGPRIVGQPRSALGAEHCSRGPLATHADSYHGRASRSADGRYGSFME